MDDHATVRLMNERKGGTRARRNPPPALAAALLAASSLGIAACFLDSEGTMGEQPASTAGAGPSAGATSGASTSGSSGDPAGATSGVGGGGVGGAGVGGSPTSSSSGDPSSSSSAGGGGPGGSNQGGSGGGAVEPLLEVSFESEPPGQVFTLPGEMKLTNPTTTRTSQTSPSTLRIDFKKNEARAHNIGLGWGLAIEPMRKNEVQQQDLTQWQNLDGATVSVAFGPHGQNDGAWQIADTSAAHRQYLLLTILTYTPSSPYVVSAWTKMIAPLTSFGLVNANQVEAMDPIQITAPDATWVHRASAVKNGVPKSQAPLVIVPRNDDADTGALAVYGVQLEEGRYPTSFIPHGGPSMNGVREADTLTIEKSGTVVKNGTVHVTLTFAPYYAIGEHASQHDLVHIGSADRLYVDFDGSFVWSTSGEPQPLRTKTFSWTRHAAITVVAKATPKGRSLSVSIEGGASDSVSDAHGKPLEPGMKVHLLGGPGGATEAADLRYLAFYPPLD